MFSPGEKKKLIKLAEKGITKTADRKMKPDKFKYEVRKLIESIVNSLTHGKGVLPVSLLFQ